MKWILAFVILLVASVTGSFANDCMGAQAEQCQNTCELYGQGPGIISVGVCSPKMIAVGSYDYTDVTCECYYAIDSPGSPNNIPEPSPQPPCHIIPSDPICGQWPWQMTTPGHFIARTRFRILVPQNGD